MIRSTLIFILMISLMACNQLPENTCECVEEALVLNDKQEKTRDKKVKENIDKKLKELSRHCQRLNWRGSTCSPEEVSVIMKKHGSGSFWDCGEFIPLVLHRPSTPYAHDEIGESGRLKNYLNRFGQESDSTWLLQLGPYETDTTQTGNN